MTVTVTLWTQGETDVGGGPSPGDCLQAFWCPEEAGGQQALSPDTDPREGDGGGPEGLLCKEQVRPQPRSDEQGTVAMQGPIRSISPVRG